MNTSATNNATNSARLRVKLAGGAAGLAIAGVILAACSVTSAGAAKSATSAGAGQYRQAVYGASATTPMVERDQLRAEHLYTLPASMKLSERDQLRAEHLFKLPAAVTLSGTPGDAPATLRLEHLAR